MGDTYKSRVKHVLQALDESAEETAEIVDAYDERIEEAGKKYASALEEWLKKGYRKGTS